MMRLAGKTALITGAARGIGRAFAQAYVSEGANVAIADIDEDRAIGAADEMGDRAFAVCMDVTDQASIDAAIAATLGQFGQIDILINNAGMQHRAPLEAFDPADFEKLLQSFALFVHQFASSQSRPKLTSIYQYVKKA